MERAASVKRGAGWYRYEEKRNAQIDPEVEALIEQDSRENGIARRRVSSKEIIKRMIYALANEGAQILEVG